MHKEVIQLLIKNEIEYYENFPLHKMTTFQIGGPAELLVMPDTTEKLAVVHDFILKNELSFHLLGGGSNLLISDDGLAGITVHPNFPEIITEVTLDGKIYLSIPASARAPWTGKKISAMGLTGAEFLATIPGEIGGAIIQNAGCYGYEIKDSVFKVICSRNGRIAELSNQDCLFKYRDSLFKKDKDIWIAGALFYFEKGSLTSIQNRLDEFKKKRLASQPRNRKSAGSVFKNPENSEMKAWQLIQTSGLTGKTSGNAEISREHCNFIVNRGHATAKDVYSLICEIENTVFSVTGIKLQREIVLAGKF